MKSIIQFKISNIDGVYVAEGVDVAIVTEAQSFDVLVQNIREAVTLHFEDDKTAFHSSQLRNSTICLGFEH